MMGLVCALALATTVSAQNKDMERAPKAQGVKHTCEMPDMGAIKQLGLTADQEAAIRDIHADCARDCAAIDKDDMQATADVKAKHQARIREVLTEEQYEKYLALGGPGRHDDPMKAKPSPDLKEKKEHPKN